MPRNFGPDYTELHLNKPVKIMAGETFGIYIHSQMDNDLGIVYDNSSHRRSSQTDHLIIKSGMAHLNCVPFLSESPWGGWGRGKSYYPTGNMCLR